MGAACLVSRGCAGCAGWARSQRWLVALAASGPHCRWLRRGGCGRVWPGRWPKHSFAAVQCLHLDQSTVAAAPACMQCLHPDQLGLATLASMQYVRTGVLSALRATFGWCVGRAPDLRGNTGCEAPPQLEQPPLQLEQPPSPLSLTPTYRVLQWLG